MFKEDLQEEIKSLLGSLEKFKELEISGTTDESLKKSFEEIKGEVIKGIEKISEDVKVLSEQSEWESFNIAFFGETNAGKSTLIEALIGGDGISIGDGRKDFTKRINKKSLGKINFLDVPGLEGNEKKVIHEIKKAVNKSHIVFYVIGTNKEPEEGTLKKVKKFLNRRAKVYSIINIRGKPSSYKYKKQLVDKNVEKMEARVREKLKDIFNEHYYGNINLNAFIGFLAKGKPNRQDLRKEQEKLKNVFGDLEKAYQFSNLYKIEQVIKDLSQRALEEIKVSNTYKFLNSLGIMLNSVLKNKKEFDIEITKINDLVEKYQQDVEKIFLKYQNYIKDFFNSILNEMENEMRKKVYKGIEDEWSESQMQKELEEIQKSYKNEIQNEMKKILKDMKTEIESKIKEFERRVNLYIKLGKFGVKVNLKEIIEKLKIDFGYIFKQILDVGLSVWGVIAAWAISPILGIITGVLVVFRKIWDWLVGDPEKRKREAKKKAYKEIKQAVEKMKNEIDGQLRTEFRKLKQQTQAPINLLKRRTNDLKKISRQIDEIIKVIKEAQKNISTLLVKEIVDKSVEFAYIDLSLSSMLVIGISEIPEYKKSILRIKDIKCFSSTSECFNKLGHKVEDKVIYVKDEFSYRALLLLDSEYKIKK